MEEIEEYKTGIFDVLPQEDRKAIMKALKKIEENASNLGNFREKRVAKLALEIKTKVDSSKVVGKMEEYDIRKEKEGKNPIQR